MCIAKALVEIQQTIEVFSGKDNPLSNLFVCPEGCSWNDDGMVYTSSEQEFQFAKVVSYGHPEVAHELLETDNTFQIKAKAKELVPSEEISPEWQE